MPTIRSSAGSAGTSGATSLMTQPPTPASHPAPSPNPPAQPATPSAKAHPAPHAARPAAVLCPYCGAITKPAARCSVCRGLLDPLSRQATQNAMGPWFIRDTHSPHRPGCSYDTLRQMAAKGRLHPDTILRGPTTRQFWSLAKRTPGVSHLVGLCYACQEEVEPTDEICRFCGVSFEVEPDRQHLGLGPIHLLPGQAAPETIAEASAAALDPSAATIGKLPGSEATAIDDSTERFVHTLAAKIRRQKWALAAVWFLALAVIGVLGALVVEARLGTPPYVTRLLLGRDPAPPATARTTAPAISPAPSQPDAAPTEPSPTTAPPAPSADQPQQPSPTPPHPTAPAPVAKDPVQSPGSSSALTEVRDLIAKDTETSLRAALEQLPAVAKQNPTLADQCKALERAASARLQQLRLKRLP